MARRRGRTWVDIDLSALVSNYEFLVRRLPPRTQVLSVVKADAYGHGMIEVARTLYRHGCRFFGVAEVEEGVKLRKFLIPPRILILSEPDPDELYPFFRYRLTPVVSRMEILRPLAQEACRRKIRSFPIHVKVDTGMGRLGLLPREIPKFLGILKSLPTLKVEGIMTHLSNALDRDFTAYQRDQLKIVLRRFVDEGYAPVYTHSSNSAAVLMQNTGFDDLVRLGIALYGASPDPKLEKIGSLRPVMSWKTRVIQVKTVPPGYHIGYGDSFLNRSYRKVAVLPVGYADGYFRSLSNRGKVLIRGKMAAVRGTVCMDLMMVEVTHIPGIKEGDPVVLLGRDRSAEIRASDLAGWAQTIPYEVFTAISSHCPRYYLPVGKKGVF